MSDILLQEDTGLCEGILITRGILLPRTVRFLWARMWFPLEISVRVGDRN